MALGNQFIERVSPSKVPRFTDQVFGRTWDNLPVILPDGRRITGIVDTTWGAWIYFEVGGVLYRTRVYDNPHVSNEVREVDFTRQLSESTRVVRTP